MKKGLKVVALVAIAICLVGIGAFAKGLFSPTNIAYYKKTGTSTCVPITIGNGVTPFDAQGSSQQAAFIDDLGNSHLIYLDQNCSTNQEAKFVP
jgi:hypothetical protein